ncbi:MAG: outer membrane lipoprotein carrier protein LolA [Thermodesulfobacteriota bacterium]|nr:outer membrane lipoprotein carrier protein LolA [Thermodesulfobacteriota bacterium]
MKTTILEWRRSIPLFYSLCASLSLLWLTIFSCGACVASESLSISEVLKGVQKRYGVTDFEADFVQESHLKAMDMVDSACGHVCFRPPAMMRWHYKRPEQYVMMTDGHSVWIYRPEENQVMVGRAVDYFGDAAWTGFFAEPDKLLEKFVLRFAAKEFAEEGLVVLELLPKKGVSNLAKIRLSISESTFDIVRSVTYNLFGDKTSIRFENFRFNQGLDSSLFIFKVPKNADVLQLEGEGG